MVAISDYEVLEKLYEGRRSLVCRAQNTTMQQSFILKLMQAEYPSLEELGRYRLEYDIINRLETDGVVQAYELIPHQNGLVLVLEDFGGESLQALLQTQRFALVEFLELAIVLTDILGRIHAANVIHKDINPANILLNPQSRQVKLIDFGNSTVLSRENPSIRNPNVLEGTLPYLSPEQTGRMNRALDYRTDFYSLGATFYEVLTGTPPFVVGDAMELVHCHLAKQPSAPHEVDSAIPEPISQLVLKLLAKNAEDRYQSAYGIKVDLQQCLAQLQRSGAIAPFPLAQQDTSGKFQIPQKLYGREAEVDLLLKAFERVSGVVAPGSLPAHASRPLLTRSELVLVAGYSGIGKSALVQEIHKPMTQHNGYFIAGKYDQFQRNIPYSAIIHAFQELIRQLLTESPEQIAHWRAQLLVALGSNGQVMIDVIPEVELIIGPQPAVAELGPRENQNRFNLVMQNFIKVFAQAGHPLVIFLDDLQWADSASLKLLNLLLTAPDSRYLLLLLSYRVNEVNTALLKRAIDEIRKAGVTVNQIELSPLGLEHVTQLIVEAFQCDGSRATPLAELVLQVTEGNPFFINQFLTSLYEEGLLNFDTQQGSWQWNLELIRTAQLPDDVVQLMAGKIQKLNTQTQAALKLAACIGNQFDSRTLAIISEKSQTQTITHLWSAVQEGLILPLGETYKFANVGDQSTDQSSNRFVVSFRFLHDRVQQVAYELIPDSDRQRIHREIGNLLLLYTPQEKREEQIFDIVNQLNMGISLIANSADREELAKLNLMAGKKAKDSAAYETAVRYLLTGIDLIGAQSWQNQYRLALALHNEAAEATYLNGEFAETERLVKQIFEHAKDILDCVKAYQSSAAAYTAQNNLEAAIYTILDATRRLGEPLPRHPNRLRVGLELFYTRFWMVGRRSMKELEALPPMTDPYKVATVNLLGSAALAAINVAPLLVAVLALRVVNLTVRYGSSPSSSVQGAAYGVMLRAGLGDIEGAYRFGQLSLRMLERSNDRIYRTMTIVAYESCIRHWKEPLRPSLPVMLAAYQEGLELGNLEFSLVAAHVYCTHSFILGEPLAEVERSFQEYITQMRQFNLVGVVYYTQPWHQLVLNLQGQASDPSRLMGTAFDEAEMLPMFTKNQQGIPLFYTHIARTIWLYFVGDYVGSLDAAKLAKPLEESAPGTPGFAMRYFYESLACLAICSRLPKAKQRHYLRRVAKNQRRAKRWAKYCPENYQHRYDLVEAERSRIAGRTTDAMMLYDRAIQGAIVQEYPSEAALANELAAKFYFQLGNDRIAQVYLLDAHYGYLRWGASFKVEALETAYPQLRDRLAEHAPDGMKTTANQTSVAGVTSSSAGNLNLDLTTVIKAAQTISGEIILDQLLAKLLELVIENAGAQKGYLLLLTNDELKIEAEGQIDQADLVIVRSKRVTNESELPLSIINYVQRTRENVVLRDALSEGLFATDPYIVQTQPRSILCSPILNQGNLMGMVYLENNLATDTFTPDRLIVLNILSAQAAIALENASFYRTLEAKVEERTAQLAAANEEITQLNQRLRSENLRMSAELDVTRRLQQLILPKEAELDQIPELEISGYMKPADEVGGDYYDVLRIGDLIKIGIGDVTGHGLESGMLMLMAQTAIRTLMLTQETDNARFLNTLNQVIFDNAQRMNSERNLTLTLIDYQKGQLRLSGQHEDVLLVRANGAVERIDTGDLGFPIGLIEDIAEFVHYVEHSLQPGDGLVLFTDGITEAMNEAEKLYGITRLCQIVSQSWQRSAKEIQQTIIEDLHSHVGQQTIFDDITLLVIKQK